MQILQLNRSGMVSVNWIDCMAICSYFVVYNYAPVASIVIANSAVKSAVFSIDSNSFYLGMFYERLSSLECKLYSDH